MPISTFDWPRPIRAVGATPRQIRSTLYRSALLVGGVAAVLGVVLGGLAALPLGRFLVDAGFQPAGFTVRWEPWALAVAFAAGPLVSLLGAAASSRRASRIAPLEALRVAEIENRPMSRSRWTAGLVAAVIGLAAGVWTSTTADVSDLAEAALLCAMALVVAATVLAPAVVPFAGPCAAGRPLRLPPRPVFCSRWQRAPFPRWAGRSAERRVPNGRPRRR